MCELAKILHLFDISNENGLLPQIKEEQVNLVLRSTNVIEIMFYGDHAEWTARGSSLLGHAQIWLYHIPSLVPFPSLNAHNTNPMLTLPRYVLQHRLPPCALEGHTRVQGAYIS